MFLLSYIYVNIKFFLLRYKFKKRCTNKKKKKMFKCNLSFSIPSSGPLEGDFYSMDRKWVSGKIMGN